jgi:uncharacterized protein (DUF1501 family)
VVMDTSRRRLLGAMGAGAGLVLCGSAFPLRLSFAATPGGKRLLLVVLRGGLDGLAAVVPYADPSYGDARGNMAMTPSPESLIDLDGHFALHGSLAPLAPLYRNKELLILHAAATPYRDRSHFDAQDMLECGGVTPHALHTGWLNRAVEDLSPSQDAIAIGPAAPLVLRGQAKVETWAPSILPDVDEDFLTRVMSMYRADPLLGEALAGARDMRGMGDGGDARGPKAFVAMMRQAAAFMAPETGPHIGAIDIGGWDTHANQGLGEGRLPRNLALLAEGLTAFREDLGAAWHDTAVLAVTEFGRTVRGNGSNGTDHGTASVAFLLGGAVNGGRVIGDWPGLAKLYEDRDLTPANDLRGLLKGTLTGHLALDEDLVSRQVFPDSEAVHPIGGLFAAV